MIEGRPTRAPGEEQSPDCRPGRLALLDGFRLSWCSTQVTLPPLEQRLLAFLSIYSPAHRALVGGTLWPELSDAHSLRSLRSALWRLRRLVPSIVTTSRDMLALSRSVSVDVSNLIEAIDLVLGGTSENVDALIALRGELLPGWYDDWVLAERARLRQLWLHAIELAGARRLSAGDYFTALRAGLEAVRVDPWRESAHRLVVLVHRAEGNNVAAIRQIESCHTILAEQGVRPSDQLYRLAESLGTRLLPYALRSMQ
jgi:DNA-binding SARP family transcriptional activator